MKLLRFSQFSQAGAQLQFSQLSEPTAKLWRQLPISRSGRPVLGLLLRRGLKTSFPPRRRGSARAAELFQRWQIF